MTVEYFNQPFLRLVNYFLYQLMPVFSEDESLKFLQGNKKFSKNVILQWIDNSQLTHKSIIFKDLEILLRPFPNDSDFFKVQIPII